LCSSFFDSELYRDIQFKELALVFPQRRAKRRCFVQWRRDGKELFYVAPDNWLMAVPIRLVPDRQLVESGAPTLLFVTHLGGAWQAPPGREYVVSSDGRFLVNTALEEPLSFIFVILNWKAKP